MPKDIEVISPKWCMSTQARTAVNDSGMQACLAALRNISRQTFFLRACLFIHGFFLNDCNVHFFLIVKWNPVHSFWECLSPKYIKNKLQVRNTQESKYWILFILLTNCYLNQIFTSSHNKKQVNFIRLGNVFPSLWSQSSEDW